MPSFLPFDMLVSTFDVDVSTPPVEPSTSSPSVEPNTSSPPDVKTEVQVDGREPQINYPPRKRVAPKRLQMTVSGQSHRST